MFPNWTASIASFSETSVGLGNTLGGTGIIRLEETRPHNIILFLGPALGSFLHMLGGYPLPFYFVGSSIVILSIFTTAIMPSTNIEVDGRETSNKNQLRVWTVLMVTQKKSSLVRPYYKPTTNSNVYRLQQWHGHWLTQLSILLDT